MADAPEIVQVTVVAEPLWSIVNTPEFPDPKALESVISKIASRGRRRQWRFHMCLSSIRKSRSNDGEVEGPTEGTPAKGVNE